MWTLEAEVLLLEWGKFVEVRYWAAMTTGSKDVVDPIRRAAMRRALRGACRLQTSRRLAAKPWLVPALLYVSPE